MTMWLLSDAVLKFQIDLIVWLQDVCEFIEPLLVVFTTWTTSSLIHFQVVPLLAAFDIRIYVTVMLVTLTSSYSVNVLKWLIADTRPYWWMSETNAYTGLMRPTIRRTQYSCEATPGCPSGHTMFNAALMYVALFELLENQKPRRSEKTFRNLQIFCWTLFSMHLTLVSMSRMYFGCHFLHQCVLGVALGIACSKYMLGPSGIVNWLLNAEKWKLFAIAGALCLIVFGVFIGYHLLGFDPLWAIRKAFKWCSDPQFVRPESTTVYLMVRDIGLVCGLAVSAPLSIKCQQRLDLKRSFPVTTITIIAYHYLVQFVPRTIGVFSFYLTTFILNFSFVFVLLYILSSNLCKYTEAVEPVAPAVASPLVASLPQTMLEGLRFEGTRHDDLANIRQN